MKAILLTFIAFLIATNSYAWNEGKPAGEKFRPEVTEAELQQQQRFQRTAGEVGGSPRDDNGESRMGPAMNDSDAARTLGGASTADAAVANLLEADARMKEKAPSAGGLPIWAIAIGAAAFGSVFAIRQWANKNIPAPINAKRSNW